MQAIPAHAFKAEPDRSYLVFCPDSGGWHVGEWWSVECSEKWVLGYDVSVELTPRHVLDVPADPLDASGTLRWMMARQMPAQRTA